MTLIRSTIATWLLDLKRTRSVTLIARHVTTLYGNHRHAQSCSASERNLSSREDQWRFRSSWRSLW